MKEVDYRSLIKVINLREKSLADALFEVEVRPYMWLSRADVFNLASFINGWLVGRRDESDEKLMRDFDVFVVDKLNQGNSTLGWCNHIFSSSGEDDSFALFFSIFREFISDGEVKNDS